MKLTIAAAQSISVCGDVEQNVIRHLRFGKMAAECGASLLVFPELSLTGYEPTIARANAMRPDSPALDPLRHWARKAEMTMAVGVPVLNRSGGLHIGTFAIHPDGSVTCYLKEYLHPGEDKVFTPGNGGPLMEIGDAKVALAICADITHAQHPAHAATRGASVYAAGVLITEQGYASDSVLLCQYAVRHKMTVLMANHSGTTGGWVSAGQSAIWSEDGRLVAVSRGTDESLVIAWERDGRWDGQVLYEY